MSDIKPIEVKGLSTKGQNFATLHNALLEAGYCSTDALETATRVYSEGIRVDCQCK